MYVYTRHTTLPASISLPISALIDPIALDPLIQAENNLAKALDGLQEQGVLQHPNRMALDELLNPQDEEDNIEETSDEEIAETVIRAFAAREIAGIDGSDEVDVSQDPLEAGLSRQNALEAARLLRHYILEVDGDTARQLDVLLGKFCRAECLEESRNMKETTLDNYFIHH